jgi:hypothetical protein
MLQNSAVAICRKGKRFCKYIFLNNKENRTSFIETFSKIKMKTI